MCCARASAARARNESAESTASSVTALGSFTAPDYGMSVATDIKARLAALDWPAIEQSLWELGYAKTPPVLTPAECTELIALYADDRRFRSRVEMARYKFGVGDYQYFDAPLPPLVEALRVHAYPPLAAIANRWEAALGTATRHPPDLPSLLALCRRRGQTKPTPLLLHYEAGGYNCLHQDLYGEIVIFTTRYRPARGTRGYYRAVMRHGVSRVRSGSRYTLGVIFHDAQ